MVINKVNLPKLLTDRLCIRLVVLEDIPQAIRYFKDNEAHLQPFGPKWPEDFYEEDFWHLRVKANIREFEQDVSVRFFVWERGRDDEIIGNLSLGSIQRHAAQFCYLGYGLSKNKQGKGFMSEAVKAVVEYGFKEKNLHRIMANYMPSNVRSGNLLRRLGFTVEGYAKDYLFLNGKWEDHILTSKSNPNWKEPAFL